MIFFFSSKTDLSVKGKESERGGSNGDRYFLGKKEKYGTRKLMSNKFRFTFTHVYIHEFLN